MKKWYRYLAAGVLVLLTLCVAGCGGVSHKSPEKITEELIQSYTDGKEKNVLLLHRNPATRTPPWHP